MAQHFTPGFPRPHPDAAHSALVEWEAHVDAGRIGRRLPVDPHVAAVRDAADAVFRDRARRRAARGDAL